MSSVMFFVRSVIASLVIVVATACTTGSHVKPLTGESLEHDPDAEAQAKLEQKSVELNKELKRRGLLFSDEEANEYINQLGYKLAPEFFETNESLHFYIVKNATANAMALPNGDIYINIGLLSVVENEDQLAAVLAHEISHVVQRHSLKSMLNREDTILAANIADIFLLGTGLSYVSAMGNLASFSREQEKEADLVSLTYLYKAGYDLNQAPVVFKLFQALPDSMKAKNSIYDSHPDNLERVRYLEEIVKDSYTGLITKPRTPEIFNKTRAKTVVSNVKIRLRNHEYKLALYTLKQAEAYYKKAPLIQYYRGEAYRLMAENPKKAADESERLKDESKNKQDIDYFTQNKQLHYRKAESLYLEALDMQPGLAVAYRGLGLVEYSNQQYEEAVKYFNTYLEMSEKPDDSLYIKRLIKNSNRRMRDKS